MIKALRSINTRLSENYPVIWISRILVVIPIALLVLPLLELVGENIPLTTGTTFLMVSLVVMYLAMLLFALRSLYLNYERGLPLWKQYELFIHSVIIIALINILALTIPHVMHKRLGNTLKIFDRDWLLIRAANVPEDEISYIKTLDFTMNPGSLDTIYYKVTTDPFLKPSWSHSNLMDYGYNVPDSVLRRFRNSYLPQIFGTNIFLYLKDVSPAQLEADRRQIPAILKKYELTERGSRTQEEYAQYLEYVMGRIHDTYWFFSEDYQAILMLIIPFMFLMVPTFFMLTLISRNIFKTFTYSFICLVLTLGLFLLLDTTAPNFVVPTSYANCFAFSTLLATIAFQLSWRAKRYQLTGFFMVLSNYLWLITICMVFWFTLDMLDMELRLRQAVLYTGIGIASMLIINYIFLRIYYRFIVSPKK